jgi:U3 small nucleolar RNA-associated protein 11
MMSSKVDKHGRKLGDRGNKSLSMDVVRLLKTQDAGYIRTTLQMVRKEREDLEQRILLVDEAVKVLRDDRNGRTGKHTVYVGDKKEQGVFDADEWFGTGGEWPDRVWNRTRKNSKTSQEVEVEETAEQEPSRRLSKKEQDMATLAEKEHSALMRKRVRAQERAAAHLETVKSRERTLMAAEEELESQRAKMNNTVGGVNKNGVKFKLRDRKR